jgi:molecular chaperone DnaJ
MNSSDQPDLYAVLGVGPDASAEQITHAYRALLRRHHPDTRANISAVREDTDDARLQLVLAAYAVLHDPAQRARYDHQHRASPPPQREHRSERPTPPISYPAPDAVVIGTVEQPRPPWISTVTSTSSQTTQPPRLAHSELSDRLRDLLDRPP